MLGGQMACDKKQLAPLAHCLFFQAWLGSANVLLCVNFVDLGMCNIAGL